MKSQTYDIFISYRREGGESAAQMIYDRLTESGYHVFLDRESLNSGDFDTKIYSVIDDCKDFLLILSPDALDRCQHSDDWVRREAEYALLKNKNIIPVIMKGFSFPEILPSSISALPSKNGVELNYEFLEAFLEKLEGFLKSSPDLFHSIRKNRLLKKSLPLFLALLAVMVIGIIGKLAYTYINSNYPFTAAQKNLTEEYLKYIDYNLVDINLMAGILTEAYDRCSYYYQESSDESQKILTSLDTAIYELTQIDTSANSMTPELKEKLKDSPFDLADAEALHNYVEICAADGIGNLQFIKKVIGGELAVSDYDASRIVNCYREFYNQELLVVSYALNENLLPVTDKETLSEFKSVSLPLFVNLPIQSMQWSDSKDELQAAQNSCNETMQQLTTELASITGTMNMETSKEEEEYVQLLMELGLTREEALESVLDFSDAANRLTIKKTELEKEQQELEELKAEMRRKFAPSSEDSVDLLWGKMLRFLNVNMYDEALNCLDYVREVQRDVDEYSPIYTAACASFIKNISKTGINYGLMITGYDPDNVNPYYEIGDVIISYNGSVVHNKTEYDAAKQGGPAEGTVKVVVMRLNDDDTWKQLTMDIPADAPGVYLSNMTEKEYE